MADIKTIHRKGEAPIVLDLENFAHLEYGMLEIEKADLPSGGSNGRCYKYVVANSVSTVTGYRQGTKKEVSSYVSTLITDLNIRTIPKKKL
ncbi:MAG TPA: hypothetical protein DDZ73_05880 [Gammaproteobacteria bacterium]|jgi:hypothetical protein|nr:MAG: hypothetical protein COA89_11045 [Acidithiobacillus sp.]RTZ64312.1 MAG: hypothetical protein DSZ34_06840 [Gammaproteobacteria bacterium]HAD37187.1 hypothetical protein [Gammaproteobacteria bacterium]HBK75913.1 hypothetical protein [Gammaproteobacteria bacterium]HHZ72588.1 hypothetical protein [Gammaproteobacteria bacterium]|tara:strand:- start:2450 stop:2722 length:273 start_codon:yes stop_codon:yes gene_type:complete